MFGLKEVRGKTLHGVIRLCSCLAFAMYGYDAGVLGGVQTTEPFLKAMGHPTGAYVIPMIASSYNLAAAVCSLAVAIIGLPLGRRNCILLGDCFVIVGAALQASSWSVAQIIASRILCGIGIGFISCTVPTYLAEMSIEAKERGPEVAFMCIWLVGGCAFAYWLDFGFTRIPGQISWRFPIAFQAVPAILSAVGFFLLPDTPRWYFARYRIEEGTSVLARLCDEPEDHPTVQELREAILTSIKLEEEETNKFRWMDLIWDRSDLRVGLRIRISFFILSIQQMMGKSHIVETRFSIRKTDMKYRDQPFGLLQHSHLPINRSLRLLAQLLAAVMNTLFAAGTVALPFTIERFGRRAILLWSAVGCTICMTIFVAMIGSPNPTLAKQWTAVSFVIIYNFIFGYGWIGVCWLYGPEIAPLKFRHIGGAAGAFGEWLFSFITVFAGGIALQNVGWKIWLWMLLSCALAVVFVYYMCPETAGKSLEEIDLIFAKQSVKDSDLANELIAHEHAHRRSSFTHVHDGQALDVEKHEHHHREKV